MPSHRYTTPAHAFDRAAIMRGAWSKARALTKALHETPAPFHRITTARAEFAHCLADVWATAKSERALSVWAAEQAAARLAPVTPLAAAQMAVVFAEHADSFTAASNAALASAHAHLATLQHAA